MIDEVFEIGVACEHGRPDCEYCRDCDNAPMTLSQFLLDIAAASRLAVPGCSSQCAIAVLTGCANVSDPDTAAYELESYTDAAVPYTYAQGVLSGFDGEPWRETDDPAEENGYALGCRLRKEALQ